MERSDMAAVAFSRRFRFGRRLHGVRHGAFRAFRHVVTASIAHRYRSAISQGCCVDHHQGRAGIGRGLDHLGQPGRVRRDHHRGESRREACLA